jgi:hypothetical protein
MDSLDTFKVSMPPVVKLAADLKRQQCSTNFVFVHFA